MPLAAHARWQGDSLVLGAVLGDAERADAPLLRSELRSGVASVAEARALGERAAAALRAQGAADYLSSSAA